jgi:hypothetical protein
MAHEAQTRSLREYGASADSSLAPAAVGIAAWWQLQHKFGYAPPVTRIVNRRAFEAEAT